MRRCGGLEAQGEAIGDPPRPFVAGFSNFRAGFGTLVRTIADWLVNRCLLAVACRFSLDSRINLGDLVYRCVFDYHGIGVINWTRKW